MGCGSVVVRGWNWAAASSRGLSHERTGTRLQDAFASFVAGEASTGHFIAIVCDGAGSAPFGGEGASLICRSVSVAIRKHFKATQVTPTIEQFEDWTDRARDLVSAVAIRRSLTPREFASTLVVAISDGTASVVAHVGDGCAVFKDEALGHWVAPSWPYHGEYASTTAFVTDEEGARINFVKYEQPISALAAFSDGIERLALDFVSRQPHQPFFEGIFRPFRDKHGTGRDHVLSEHLKSYLNSPSVNSRTDDDKSLILAVRR